MSQDWSIDTIVHALPSPELRQKALRDIHLAPLDQLARVVAKWQTIGERWKTTEQPRIDAARAHLEEHNTLPDEYTETEESAQGFDAWKQQMEQLRQQRGAA
ncbi:hypothetical protein [Streptomyces sp. N35]|uniref:hypothetical protein n=1 Tax=Streptomyces sp. N35 TaxID=2795730 RepID=UPI0018F51B9F|nr:hypothetical protein [Streptomyces sp. N35]